MRPLLILDCDEVILSFAAPFRRWLAEAHGMELRFDSFALSGNIRRSDGSVVGEGAFPALLDGFFAEGQRLQTPVEGVAEALEALTPAMDIVVLTNIPEPYRLLRAEILRSHGLELDVYANAGPKGRLVAALAGDRPAVFVDDLPPHHESAARHAPRVGRLHMVADPELRALIPAAPHAHARIDGWAEARGWIETYLESVP
ncbi:HAD family hydrolase [Thermaurantiacus sp.]